MGVELLDELTVRDGAQMLRPISQNDLSDVAHIHTLAFPDSALTMLGTEAVRRYYDWQLTGPHDMVALCLVEDEKVTAFCFGGLFRGALRGFLDKNRGYLLWCIVRQPWVVLNPIIRRQITVAIQSLKVRYLVSSSADPARRDLVHRPSFGVLAIAVNPAAAGQGQGQRLMKCLEDTARKRQFSAMHLTVSPDNTRAVGFYERLGWLRAPEEGAWTGFMKKDLSSG